MCGYAHAHSLRLQPQVDHVDQLRHLFQAVEVDRQPANTIRLNDLIILRDTKMHGLYNKLICHILHVTR